MLRSFYRCALRLHPPAFRQRFGNEMLAIFDQEPRKLPCFKLVIDGFFSLLRQWTLRPEFWYDLSPASSTQAIPDGIPSFYTIAPFRPRSGAVVDGLVLSLAIFCLTCFATKYSWIRVLHLHIREIQFEAETSIHPSASPSAFWGEPTAAEHAPVTPSPLPERFLPPASSSSPVLHRAAVIPNNTAHLNAATNFPAQQPSTKPKASQPQTTASTATPPLPRAQSSNLDAAERQLVLESATANLHAHYFDPAVAQEISDTLQTHQKNGDYDAQTDGTIYAQLLTAHMRAVSHDMHLEVVYSETVLPEQVGITPERLARYRAAMLWQHCTFEKIQILPHNVGYLKLNSFPDPSICKTTAVAAMSSLNRADAIIFDLRENRGGEPAMVALMAAYLFDHPEYWYNPRAATTSESWTGSPVPGNRLADKPVYVLTSVHTASGAEQFSYNLKMLKRATLVGEKTAGAAHAGVFYRIDDHFGIGIPETKAINPFEAADWAEVGVEPDVKVPAPDALATAQKLALAQLRKKQAVRTSQERFHSSD